MPLVAGANFLTLGRSCGVQQLDALLDSDFDRPMVEPSLRYRASATLAYRLAERRIRMRYPSIHSAQIAARSDGGLAGEYQWLRLAELDSLLRRHRPRSVTEFGSGTSSAMFAQHSDLTTVEESPYWHERFLATMEPWSGRFQSLRVDRVLTNSRDEQVVHYDVDHTREAELVYVDGPYTDDTDPPHAPCVDVELMWEAGNFPRIVLVDGRRKTVRRLLRSKPRDYEAWVKSDYLRRQGGPTPSMFRYHTIFLRGTDSGHFP